MKPPPPHAYQSRLTIYTVYFNIPACKFTKYKLYVNVQRETKYFVTESKFEFAYFEIHGATQRGKTNFLRNVGVSCARMAVY